MQPLLSEASIIQFREKLNETGKELVRLKLDEAEADNEVTKLSEEEIERRVALLDSCLIRRAHELGKPEPTVEERAKMLIEYIDNNRNH